MDFPLEISQFPGTTVVRARRYQGKPAGETTYKTIKVGLVAFFAGGFFHRLLRGRAAPARQAHNLKVGGWSPPPASKSAPYSTPRVTRRGVVPAAKRLFFRPSMQVALAFGSFLLITALGLSLLLL